MEDPGPPWIHSSVRSGHVFVFQTLVLTATHIGDTEIAPLCETLVDNDMLLSLNLRQVFFIPRRVFRSLTAYAKMLPANGKWSKGLRDPNPDTQKQPHTLGRRTYGNPKKKKRFKLDRSVVVLASVPVLFLVATADFCCIRSGVAGQGEAAHNSHE